MISTFLEASGIIAQHVFQNIQVTKNEETPENIMTA